jgi:DNA-binding transcriptional MerR regulator
LDKSPDAFRTISEAAEELDLPQHVLRFWETRFNTIRPLKRGGGRRYYRPEDVMLLRGIRHLLYDQGFTIKGVQKILKDQGPRYVIAVGEGKGLDEILPLIEQRMLGTRRNSKRPRCWPARPWTGKRAKSSLTFCAICSSASACLNALASTERLEFLFHFRLF